MANNNEFSEQEYLKLVEEKRQALLEQDGIDPLTLVDKIYQLWWRWADFHLVIESPDIPPIDPPLVIGPEPQEGSKELEFVYSIHDHGYKLSTSKGDQLYSAGMSMCKLYFTIEKMIFLLIERLKTGGISSETEVRVLFEGHELAQRKAFESIINLNWNVVVTNFEPGLWGERYLQTVKRLADKGYGYPPEAPRDIYRHPNLAAKALKR